MTAARAMPLTGISNALGHAVFAIRHEGVRAATHPLCMSPNVGSDETCCVCPRLREREREYVTKPQVRRPRTRKHSARFLRSTDN